MDFDTPAAHIADDAPVGYLEYEIDVEKVLRQDLPKVIELGAIAPLTLERVAAIPERAKGAYLLYLDGRPVYAGKTDTRHGFRSRLTRHYHTIQDRKGLDPQRIGFKAVRILVFSNFDVEAILINELRSKDPEALKWNTSGFGSNDPGHNRETQEPADFDKANPIDIDKPLDLPLSGRTLGVVALLVTLKDGLPYTFRYETGLNEAGRPNGYRLGHADHRAAPEVTFRKGSVTMRAALQNTLDVLPYGWRATVFPDRVILYREATRYPHALEQLQAAR